MVDQEDILENLVSAVCVLENLPQKEKYRVFKRHPGSKKMINHPISDMFTRIRNAGPVRRNEIVLPYSKLKEAVSRVLQKEEYLSDVKKVKNSLFLKLAFSHRKPVITHIKSVSKPGLRIYRKADSLPRPLGGKGLVIVSTPQGIMSGKDARKKGLGGEILGEVW